jgi:GNAT superfamily N-acetyltransferase
VGEAQAQDWQLTGCSTLRGCGGVGRVEGSAAGGALLVSAREARGRGVASKLMSEMSHTVAHLQAHDWQLTGAQRSTARGYKCGVAVGLGGGYFGSTGSGLRWGCGRVLRQVGGLLVVLCN